MARPRVRKPKRIIIIAGPNGAGKTTFAQEFLPSEAGVLRFINADLISQGLSPFAPGEAAISAGKIMLLQIAAYVAAGKSFAFETTPSGRNYARHIPRWQKMGYHVKLIFFRLPSAGVAIRRVRSRVRHGGHNVPDEAIRRRFAAGLRNFQLIYKGLVNSWALYDNSFKRPSLIDSGDNP
ncbi:MAG TPA: AAA family ATPase [Tepidisphaeraceae bacterium]|jgi:predicted ABC-type ATPase|nr:AAA family ATPase [Tepidisphaeraceae bacterium]